MSLMKRIIPVAAILVIANLSGCAYFNAFYLAKKNFKDGERLRERDNGLVTQEAGKKYNDAVKWAREVIDEYPDSRYVDDSIFIIGMSKYQQKDYVIARAQFDDLINRFPTSEKIPDARYFLAQSYIGLGQYENAKLVLNEIVKGGDKKEKERAGVAFADIALFSESWEELLAGAQAVIDAEPEEAALLKALYLKGEAFFQLENHQECLDALKRLDGKKLDPDLRVKVNTRIAQATAKMGKYDEGLGYLTDLEKRGEFKRFAPRIRLEIGYIHELKGDLEQASKTYGQMAADFPDSLPSKEAWYRVGMITIRDLSKIDDARADFVKVGKPAQGAQGQFFADAEIKIAQIDTLKAIQKRIDEAKEKIEIKTKARFSLAEMYTYSFDHPDSAMTQYQYIMEESPDSEFAVMSDYYFRRNEASENGGITPEKERAIIEEIVKKYPDSDFSGKLRAYVGIDETSPHILALRKAEKAKYSGADWKEYIPLYEAVVDSFPKTRSACLARFVLAYSYEHEAGDMDTALEYYKALADEEPNFVNFEYVAKAREKLKYNEQIPQLLADIKKYLDSYEERKVKGFATEEPKAAETPAVAVGGQQQQQDTLTGFQRVRARNARIRSRYFTN